MARRGNGRQKVVMERVQNETSRQVTFSKRRAGLMKKGSELCTLCGAEVAIVVFSPGGKVFSFGHPSADAVMQRFLGEESEPGGDQTTHEIVRAHRCTRQSELNFKLTQLEGLVDAEQRKGEAIDQERHETEGKVWWEKPIEELSVKQLELLMVKMREFKDNVDEEVRLLRQAEGFNEGGLSNVMGAGSYGGLVARSSGQEPLDTWISRGTDRVTFNPMAAGSTLQTPLDRRTLGFYGRPPYNPMAAGSSGVFDQMGMGSTSGSRMSFNPNHSGVRGRAPVDPNAPSPSNGGN